MQWHHVHNKILGNTASGIGSKCTKAFCLLEAEWIKLPNSFQFVE